MNARRNAAKTSGGRVHLIRCSPPFPKCFRAVFKICGEKIYMMKQNVPKHCFLNLFCLSKPKIIFVFSIIKIFSHKTLSFNSSKFNIFSNKWKYSPNTVGQGYRNKAVWQIYPWRLVLRQSLQDRPKTKQEKCPDHRIWSQKHKHKNCDEMHKKFCDIISMALINDR